MEASHARRIIESLRFGIPPDGYVCDFTVGRKRELEGLRKNLHQRDPKVLLLNANYGAGKTHLLRLIREEALRNGWMVSLVTVDAKSGVRFDLLSQILGAVCRCLEVPGEEGKGIRCLFNAFRKSVFAGKVDADFWGKLHNGSKWDRIQQFESEPFYLSIRAWFFCESFTEDYIENWIQSPDKNPDGRVTHLYNALIKEMKNHFRDSRPREYFSKQKLELSRNDDLCWAFLRDADRAARAIGFKGLVLCFDEFEDVIHNVPRIDQTKMAFCNMFELFYGQRYRAQAYFAVTPGFVDMCKQKLQRRWEYDYDYSQFDGLDTFQMAPIGKVQLKALGRKILKAHSFAYSWEPPEVATDIVEKIAEVVSEFGQDDRVRVGIRIMIEKLDELMDGEQA